MLAQNRWWFGSRKNFDDSEDFVFPGIRQDHRLAAYDLERAKDDMQEVLDKTGVFCLSERADHPKLWSLYAAEGAGLCLELESDYVTDPDYGPFRVKYSDRPKPEWEHGGTREKRNKLATAALLQKSTVWGYQAEWRCIRIWPQNARATAGRYYSMATRSCRRYIRMESIGARAATSDRMDPCWILGAQSTITRGGAGQRANKNL
jgi:hypothetical protein